MYYKLRYTYRREDGMPVVIWGPNNKFRIIINAGDHAPPHVHVIFGKGRGSCELRISIKECTLLTMRGSISRSDLDKIATVVETNQELLIDKWEEYNEQD